MSIIIPVKTFDTKQEITDKKPTIPIAWFTRFIFMQIECLYICYFYMLFLYMLLYYANICGIEYGIYIF